MYGWNKVPPNPYEYPSADDYYDAVDEYNDWLRQKEEAEAIAADLAYERSLEIQWRQEAGNMEENDGTEEKD